MLPSLFFLFFRRIMNRMRCAPKKATWEFNSDRLQNVVKSLHDFDAINQMLYDLRTIKDKGHIAYLSRFMTPDQSSTPVGSKLSCGGGHFELSKNCVIWDSGTKRR